MFLVITKYGGIYLCAAHKRLNGWYRLEDVYFIRRTRSITKYSSVELRSKYITIVEEKEFKIDFEQPRNTYNNICAFINNNESLKNSIKKELKTIKEDDA